MEKNIAENKMKTYLGERYTENHLHNFLRYWMKASEGNGDDWRRENDLDCLYFDGDLRADTLMSAWTPVKWVADCLNRAYGKKFHKKSADATDPHHDLKLLLEDTDAWLPPKHELVLLLQEFLELAEQRCNYILLPDRDMNPDRYRIEKNNGEELWLFDEVPATLYHIFMGDTLGKYFEDFFDAVHWVEREHLEIGFTQEPIAPLHVRPLVPGMEVGEARWLTEEREIAEALKYMIRFLKERRALLQAEDLEQMTQEIICFLQKWGLWQDVAILVNGKRYREDATEDCENPEEYTSGLINCGEWGEDQKTKWVSYANPEHIFDMVYEGPLSVLLYEREYETSRSAVSDAAWEEIFRKTDLLERYIQENYEVWSPEALLEGYASKTCAWDPLVFDTWEEYQETAGWEDEELQPRYQSFDTYEDYQECMDREWTVEDVMPLWEKFLDKVKDEVRTDGERLYCPEMTGYIIAEFDRIFERYGLWYELDFSWSLSCYRL